MRERIEKLKEMIIEPANMAGYFEYLAPKVNRREVERYAGYLGGYQKPEEVSLPDIDRLIDDALILADKELTFRVAYYVCPISWDREGCAVLPIGQKSKCLSKNLKGCSIGLIFTATIGAGIDRLIRRYERTQPARGLMLQATGAERVESLCDLFNEEVRLTAGELGFRAHARYSPGFGDLPITVQPEVLRLTNAEKRLGITINESYLMSPSKSVTAIIGLEKYDEEGESLNE